jgi:uncharacterized membrane protein YqjE
MSEAHKTTTAISPDTGKRADYDGSVGGLLRQLTHEVPDLITKELALAKAELSESIRATTAGAASVATGGAVLLGGFIVLLMSAVYGLSEIMAPWLAALIVGGVVVVIGLIMVSAGKKKFEASSFKPERTLHSMHKDKEAVRGHTS